MIPSIRSSFSLYAFLFLLVFPLRVFSQFNVKRLEIQARHELANEEYDKALATLNRCIYSTDANAGFYALRGYCKFQLNDMIGAEQDLNVALASSFLSGYDESLHCRAITRYRLGKYAESLADFDLLIFRKQSDKKIVMQRAYCKLALRDFNGAIADCDLAKKYGAITDENLLCKGMAYDALKEYSLALQNLDSAVMLNYKNPESWVRRGITKQNMLDYHAALADFNGAVFIDSTYTFAYFSRADVRSKLKDSKGAIADYNRVLNTEPTNSYALFNRGIVLYNLGKTKEALNDLSNVIVLNPFNIQAYISRAQIRSGLKQYKEALADYDKAIELFPYLVSAYYERSDVKAKMNDLKGAANDKETAKLIGDINLSKSEMQLARDSSRMVSLLNLRATFDNTASATNDSLDLGLRPIYRLTVKDNVPVQSYIYNLILTTFPEKGMEDFTLSNADAQSLLPMDVGTKGSESKQLFYKATAFADARKFSSADSVYRILLAKDSSAYITRFSSINCRLMIALDDFVKRESSASDENRTAREQLNHDLERVLNEYRYVLNGKFESSVVYYNMAFVETFLGNSNAALIDLQKATVIDPAFRDAYYNMAILLYRMKEYSSACSFFSKAGGLGSSEAFAFMRKYCNGNEK